MNTEIGALRQVLPQQPVCVLVGGPLLWVGRVAEVDRQARRLSDRVVFSLFGIPIPC